MEGVGVESAPSASKQLDDAAAWYMACGMPYSEYWDGDIDATHIYRKAFELKCAKQNHDAWLQGLYIYHAIGSFAEILPAFPKKNAKINNYISEPFAITKKDQEEKERKKMIAMREQMMRKAMTINAKMPS